MEEYIYNKNLQSTQIDIDDIDIPKAFWRYFDLFRRGKLTLSDFSNASGIAESRLLEFLAIL